MSVDTVDISVEDSFAVFISRYGGFEVKALNPDGGVAFSIAIFEEEVEAIKLVEELREHTETWVEHGAGTL